MPSTNVYRRLVCTTSVSQIQRPSFMTCPVCEAVASLAGTAAESQLPPTGTASGRERGREPIPAPWSRSGLITEAVALLTTSKFCVRERGARPVRCIYPQIIFKGAGQWLQEEGGTSSLSLVCLSA